LITRTKHKLRKSSHLTQRFKKFRNVVFVAIYYFFNYLRKCCSSDIYVEYIKLQPGMIALIMASIL